MLKKYKNKIIVFSLIIIGIAFILLGSLKFDKKTENNFHAEYTKELENKIEDFLKNVDGIKKVKVIITLDSSEESVYAQGSNGMNIAVSNDGSPISVTEIYPTVRGVAIACTNGDSDFIKMKVTELVSAYLGISSNRIKIVSIG